MGWEKHKSGTSKNGREDKKSDFKNWEQGAKKPGEKNGAHSNARGKKGKRAFEVYCSRYQIVGGLSKATLRKEEGKRKGREGPDLNMRLEYSKRKSIELAEE